MLEQAQTELPNECCGLLAGKIEETATGLVKRVLRRYPLINAAASPVEYLSEPSGMFRAVKDMRRDGTEVVAIYHSHPTSAPIPSKQDLERNYWPEVLHLIISLKSSIPEMRAWSLGAHDFQPAEIECIEG